MEEPDGANTADPELTSPNGGEENNATATQPDNAPPMSKNQLKKLLRKQKWDQDLEARRARRREKNKERKARRQARAANPDESSHPNWKEQKKHHRSQLLPLTFIYDCAFDELMTEPERISLASQLTRAYSDNRKANYRAGMIVSSFGGKLKERFDGVLTGAYKLWKGTDFLAADVVQAAEQARQAMTAPDGEAAKAMDRETIAKLAHFFHDGADKLALSVSQGDEEPKHAEMQDTIADLQNGAETVYLTSDSPNTLHALKPFSTYIIGGIVDKNRHKGICYKRACDLGIATAKLPIGDYMRMSSRHVLTTNHVGEIMLRWLEFGDWGAAFEAVIPKRKGGVLRDAAEDGELDARDAAIDEPEDDSDAEDARADQQQDEVLELEEAGDQFDGG